MKPYWGLVLLVILMTLTGCGSQDRYEVMPAQVNVIVEGENWGTATALKTIHNNYSSSLAAMVAGQLYFGAGGEMVYVVTPTGFETLPRPGDLNIGGLTCGPDGLLWMTDQSGRILYFEDGAWVLDEDLQLVRDSGTRLLLDDQNRILFMGDRSLEFQKGVQRHLWRRDHTGQWTQQEFSDEADIMHGWCEHGKPPVFLTRHLQLVTEGAEGWQVSDPLLEDIDEFDVEFQCSEDGQMAIRIEYEGYFLLNEGDGWQVKDTGSRLGHLFWVNNELYAISQYGNDLLHWDAEAWEFYGPSNVLPRFSHLWSIPHNSGRIVFSYGGESQFFDGTEVARITHPMGNMRSFFRYEGQDHVYLSEGMHLRGNNGVWEVAGWPFADVDRSSTYLAMVVDDQDQLMFFNDDQICRWDGETYHKSTPEHYLANFFMQEDGKVLFFSDGWLGVWSQGQLQWVGYADGSNYSIRGARWLSDDKIQIVFHSHMLLVEPHGNTIVLTFQGWRPNAIAGGPGESLGCFGRERSVVIDGTDVQDITPVWDSPQGDLARISKGISDGFGGWLAFEYDRSVLLRYDGQQWSEMPSDFRSTMESGGYLTNNNDGTFTMQNGYFVYRIEPELQP